MDYRIIQPRPGYVVLKEAEQEKTVLKTSGQGESNAYGEVVSIAAGSKLEIGQTVLYNEFEGQELIKHGPITEDHIIIISEDNILAIINEV